MFVCRSRGVLALVALVAAISGSLAFGISSAFAGRIDPPGHSTANQCFNTSGVDLNALYGVSDQFRTRECQMLTAGEHWIRLMAWIVNFESGSVYPDGYVPSRPAPIDDFMAKLVAIKVVVDAGTRQEQTHVFPPSVARTDINIDQLEPGVWGAPYPMASMLPRVRPLSVGDHTHQPFVVLSAEHCDGLGKVVADNCLPAGDIPFAPLRPLTVTTPTP